MILPIIIENPKGKYKHNLNKYSNTMHEATIEGPQKERNKTKHSTGGQKFLQYVNEKLLKKDVKTEKLKRGKKI